MRRSSLRSATSTASSAGTGSARAPSFDPWQSKMVSYDGEIFSWGGNSSGQVGDRTREDRELPKMIIGTGFVKLRSHEEMVDSMMKNNAKAVDDDDAEASRSRPGSGRCLSAAGAAVVGRVASGPPQLLLRAAGVSGGQRALLRTSKRKLALPPPRPMLLPGPAGTHAPSSSPLRRGMLPSSASTGRLMLTLPRA